MSDLMIDLPHEERVRTPLTVACIQVMLEMVLIFIMAAVVIACILGFAYGTACGLYYVFRFFLGRGYDRPVVFFYVGGVIFCITVFVGKFIERVREVRSGRKGLFEV